MKRSSSSGGRKSPMWCLPLPITVSSSARALVFSISLARFLCSHVPPSVSSSESYSYCTFPDIARASWARFLACIISNRARILR
uniref:Putative secreted protein n=1 Tax=Ixodes ricinus TaxID=34613 RepID=A0A6B0U7L5_IXORI